MAGPDDPRIEAQNFLGSVNVVDFGDIRVARGLSRRSPLLACAHRKMVYDERERRIWCDDCESTVEPFDAFRALVEQFDKASKRADKEIKEARAALEHSLIARAAKVVDKAWRSRRMAPCCPHCSRGLLPEDFANGLKRSVSLMLERQKRKSNQTPPHRQ